MRVVDDERREAVIDLDKMHRDAEDLERYLRLQTYPLAIRLLRSESEIPEEARRPKRDEGCQYNACQAFALSRRNGFTMALLKEDMYCFEPVIGYGMGEPPQEFLDGQNRYPGDVVVKLDTAPQGGAIFVGERGVVTVACGLVTWDPPELGRDAPPNTEIFYGHKGPLHTRQWFQCLRSRQQPNCVAETGHRTATVAHVGNIARWLGRKLRWDPAAERFVGDDEANAPLSRPMRTPWHL